ncbi:S8 family serine peptidase [Coraliomargarita sp. SDUM461003]|uniref:S8 family serine peptidase n=1 Tax=Thalassobacterium maritimum TaxID=3041265 RepID=A0ABU1AZD9_9BACT|nr:Ig-like domain-containing protein [Coraliomargarita sp. SDUM461003]MDQ8209500.1 S8 family serine peptidase [Coraliomargarita sp. SDUM461003]
MKIRYIVFGAFVCTLVAAVCWMLSEGSQRDRVDLSTHKRMVADSAVEVSPSDRVLAVPSPRANAPLPESLDSMLDEPEFASAQLKREFYESGKVLEQVESEPDADGVFERITVKEVDAKYPYVRIEERIARDPLTGEEQLLEQLSMVADHLLVRLADNKTEAQLSEFVVARQGTMRRFVPSQPLFIVGLPSHEIEAYDLSLAAYSMDEAPVTYAEPDFTVHSFALTNDPYFGTQWNLNNIGQVSGVLDADIDAFEAWDIETGDSSLVVGIIDTGVNLQHVDLVDNLWVNTDEIPDNGIDDDSNGYIDDVYGWDFHNGDNDPTDDNGHGTHCAGIVGAVGNNGIGVSGVAQDVSLMALKFLSNQAGGNLSDAVPALYYATDNGAFVTSNSWGGGGYSQAMSEAIEYARQADSIFVAAAGNEAQDTDALPVYPACYPQDNIVSVAATDRYDELAYYTNTGALTVDIAAPGTGIYSTDNGGAYNQNFSLRSGTSMAAPQVAGAAVLLKASDPSLSAAEMIDRMMVTADLKPALIGKVASSGRLNVNAALRSATGSYLSHVGSSFIEVIGNGDSVINPGESFDYSISLKNAGTVMAKDVTATVSLLYPDDDIVLLDTMSSVGNVEAGATVDTAFDPFRFSLSEVLETPKEFRLVVTVTDEDLNEWSFEQVFSAFTSTTISGNVLSLTDSNPIVGAKIYYWGDSEGVVDVDALGFFSFEVLDGTYFFHVVAEGYVNSDIIVVDETFIGGNNILLGKSHLHVSGSEVIEASQLQDAVTMHELVVTNQGDVPLVYTADVLSGASNLGGSIEPLFESWESNQVGLDYWGDEDQQSFVSDRYGLTGNNSYYSHFRDESWNGFRHDLSYLPTRLGVESVAVWVRPTLEDPANGIVSVYTDKSDYNSSKLLFSYNSSKLLYHEEYEGEEWFHLEFRDFHYGAAGDFLNNWCEVYINGEYAGRLSMMPFSKSQLGGITEINLENERGGSSYWDDIHIEFDDLSWVESSARGKRLTLGPGESSTVRVTIDSTDIDPGDYEMQLRVGSNDPVNGPVFIPIQIEVLELPNLPPVAESVHVQSNEDTELIIELEGSDPDGNPMVAWVTEMPAKGKLYQVLDADVKGEQIREPGRVTNEERRVLYVPEINGYGEPYETFRFCLKDKRSESLEASVVIDILPVNDGPVARNDSIGAVPGETIEAFSVLENDSDPEGDALSLLSYTSPAKGQLVHLGVGKFEYTPNPTFLGGSDRFSYTIQDPEGEVSTASVVIRYGSVMNGAWPMAGGNAQKTGYYPGTFDGQAFRKIWEKSDVGAANGGVLMSAERVYLEPVGTSDSHTVKALSVSTGLVEWEFTSERSLGSGGQPVLGGNLLVYRLNHWNEQETVVYAIDSGSGQLVWETLIDYTSSSGSPRIFKGRVYIGARHKLTALDLATGEVAFTRDVEGYIEEWEPVFQGDEAYLCVDGVLFAFDSTDGSDLWSLSLLSEGYPRDAASIVCDSGIAVVNMTYEIIAVDLSTRSIKWRVDGIPRSKPVVGNGVMYVERPGRQIEAFSMVDGSSIRTYDVNTDDVFDMFVTDDSLVVSAYNFNFWVFDLATGLVQQTFAAGGFSGYVSFANGALALSHQMGGGMIMYMLESEQNSVPAGLSEEFILPEDSDASIELKGSDADGDPLFAMLYSLPKSGLLFQTTDGIQPEAEILEVPCRVDHPEMKLIYRPPSNHAGSAIASFEFKVNDGTYFSDTAIASITISNVNDAPSAYDDRIPLREGEVSVRFNPLHNDFDLDGDALTISGYTQPSYGTVVLDGEHFIYTSDGSGEYIDTFTYMITDASGGEAGASISILNNPDDGLVWEMEGTDASRDGFIPVLMGEGLLAEKWAIDLGGVPHRVVGQLNCIFITPEYNDRTVFRNEALAIDRQTGGICWSASLTNSLSAEAFNAPVLSGGVLLASTRSSGRMVLLDSEDGSQIWEVEGAYRGEIVRWPLIDGDRIWAGHWSTDAGLSAFDLNAGEGVLDLGLTSSYVYDRDVMPLVSADGVLTSVSGTLIKNDVNSGEVIWRADLGAVSTGYDSPISSSGGIAFSVVLSEGGIYDLVAIDLQQGAILWRIAGDFLEAVPSIADGLVFCMMEGAKVNAYDVETGVLVRSYETNYHIDILDQPIISLDRLFLRGRNQIYVFDLFSGELLQEIPHKGEISLLDDMLLIAGSDGVLRAFRVQDAVNAAPTATTSSVRLLEDSQLIIKLEANDLDSDVLSFSIVELPKSGQLYQIGDDGEWGDPIKRTPAAVSNSNGYVGYIAPDDLFGDNADVLSFIVADDDILSDPVEVQIGIQPVQDPPIARNDVRGTKPGEEISNLRLTFNDIDVDGDPLTVISFTQPESGMITQNVDGSLRYVPLEGVVDITTTFEYTIADGHGGTDVGSVEISIVEDFGENWITFQSGGARTGFSMTLQEEPPFLLDWSIDLPSVRYYSVIYEGRVIVADWLNSKVSSFNLSDGSLQWSEAPYSEGDYLYPISVYNGIIYFEADERIVAMSVDDGSTLWELNVPDVGHHEPISVTNDTIWLPSRSTSSPRLYALNPASGSVKFALDLDFPIGGRFSAIDDKLYVFSGDALHCFNSFSGAHLWSLSDEHLSSVSGGRLPLVALSETSAFLIDVNEELVSGESSYELVSIDTVNQEVRWSRPIDSLGTPAYADGEIYGNNYDGVSVFDEETGDDIFSYNEGVQGSLSSLSWGPIVSHNLVISGSGSETFIWERFSGRLIQKLPYSGYLSLTSSHLLITVENVGVYAYLIPSLTFDPIDQTASAEPIAVGIESSVSGSTVYYTLDGSVPDESSRSIVNGGHVLVNMSSTINTIVTKEGQSSSSFDSSYIITDEGNLIPDWWEAAHFGTPGATDGLSDSDGDGRSDYEEWMAGSDPMDRNDYLAQRFDPSSLRTGDFSLKWNSVEDRFYRVKWSDDLSGWLPISSWMQGSGELMDFTDQVDSMANPSGFYLIEVQP